MSFCCNTIPGVFVDEDVTHIDGEVNPVRDLVVMLSLLDCMILSVAGKLEHSSELAA